MVAIFAIPPAHSDFWSLWYSFHRSQKFWIVNFCNWNFWRKNSRLQSLFIVSNCVCDLELADKWVSLYPMELFTLNSRLTSKETIANANPTPIPVVGIWVEDCNNKLAQSSCLFFGKFILYMWLNKQKVHSLLLTVDYFSEKLHLLHFSHPCWRTWSQRCWRTAHVTR